MIATGPMHCGGAGIADMTAKVLANARVGEAALIQEGRNDKRNETARQDGESLGASQHAGAIQGGMPEKGHLQQQSQPKLQLKQQSEQQHTPIPKLTPTLARRWDTIQSRAQGQKAPTGLPPAPTCGSSMAKRRLISNRDGRVPLPNKMEQGNVWPITRALFHQKAVADIPIMNARRNAKGAIIAITQQNAKAAIAVVYREVIINTACTVDKGVIDVEENQFCETLKAHAVPLVRSMGKGTEGLH